MAMDNTFDKTALETIDLLEARLKRIEYAICGHVNPATISSDENASKRLAELEHSLHTLASKSKVIQELLKLRMSLS
jgi:chromosome segregation ATPase